MLLVVADFATLAVLVVVSSGKAENLIETFLWITKMKNPQIPLTLKLTYSAFMCVLIPFYWSAYGPTNFLYFCDIALFLTLWGMWRESATLISAAAVGILLPQVIWVADFMATAAGYPILGMTEYMFRDSISLFARGLSLFHGWLPFLLIYLVYRIGHQPNGIKLWTIVAWAAMLICFYFMPAPGESVSTPNTPININYVYGFSETEKQQWLSDGLYLLMMMCVLPLLVYWPTDKALAWMASRRVETTA